MNKIVIVDFGSQFTQLIARRLRELYFYSLVVPYNKFDLNDARFVKGIILSGSPASVNDDNFLTINQEIFKSGIPVLGICYGAQLIVKLFKGKVDRTHSREFGRSYLKVEPSKEQILFDKVPSDISIWMSHGDSITELPSCFKIIAKTNDIPVAAFSHTELPIYAVQFHPEVSHTDYGIQMLENFALKVCKIQPEWTPQSFIESKIQFLKETVKNDAVIMGLSGGVDSSVAALLLHKAIEKQLFCIFVDNGLLRKNEYEQVLNSYKGLGLNIIGVDAKKVFLDALANVSDPETKRKIIGKKFIEVFEAEGKKIDQVKWLGQGTIYPDIIESVSVNGPSSSIKSHHNVGGLPEKMGLSVIEPLKELFKDEVRRVGTQLDVPKELLNRHPFPGPGLAIRILGEVTSDKVKLLQDADEIFINLLKKHDLYDKVWQAGVILLPVKSVGVMGDERTYENVVCLRAVSSQDGMTADWIDFPHHFLAEVSNQIINKVSGINRVVYDISSKPPATIEWE